MVVDGLGSPHSLLEHLCEGEGLLVTSGQALQVATTMRVWLLPLSPGDSPDSSQASSDTTLGGKERGTLGMKSRLPTWSPLTLQK